MNPTSDSSTSANSGTRRARKASTTRLGRDPFASAGSDHAKRAADPLSVLTAPSPPRPADAPVFSPSSAPASATRPTAPELALWQEWSAKGATGLALFALVVAGAWLGVAENSRQRP